MKTFLLTLLVLMGGSWLYSQVTPICTLATSTTPNNGDEICPLAYFPFNASYTDSDHGPNTLSTNFPTGLTVNSLNGACSEGILMDENSSGELEICQNPLMANDEQLSYEFMFKTDPGFLEGTLLYQFCGPYLISLYYQRLEITVRMKDSSTPAKNFLHKLVLPFNGVNRRSYEYYTDGNWHHIFVCINVNDGSGNPKIKLFVDGYSDTQDFENTTAPSGKTAPYFIRECSSTTCSSLPLIIGGTTQQDRFLGSFDEFAAYGLDISALSEGHEFIYSHYENMEEGDSGLDFTYPNQGTYTLPSTMNFDGDLEEEEFYHADINTGLTIADPDESLAQFPGARYNRYHTMTRNFPFIIYTQSGITADESDIVQEDLLYNFNYPILLTTSAAFQASAGNWNTSTSWIYHWTDLALSLSDCPTAAITNWNNCYPDAAVTECSGDPNCTAISIPGGASAGSVSFVKRFDLPSLSGQRNYFYNDHPVSPDPGGEIENNSGDNQWSYANPLDWMELDGEFQAYWLNKISNKIGRGIDFIGENGEVIPNKKYLVLPDGSTSTDETVITAIDDQIDADFDDYVSALGSTIPNPNGNEYSQGWNDYVSLKKGMMRSAYRDGILNNLSSTPITLPTSHFTYYDVGGYNANSRFSYERNYEVNSYLTHGSNSYTYATPYFYPQRPEYWWEKAFGSLSGINNMANGRLNELAMQPYFAPYVSPGINDGGSGDYAIDYDKSMRPGQYLALLKALGMMGAEYYHTFFYVLSSETPIESTIWQLVMPSYSQAVFSRKEDFFRNSHLLTGDFDINPSGCNQPTYRFRSFTTSSSANFNDVIMVRRGGTEANPENKFLITGSIQRQSNYFDPNQSKEVTIKLEDNGCPTANEIDYDGTSTQIELSFEIRSQGSTYYFDATDDENLLFYQVDKWHGWQHPFFWDKDIHLEAELYDLKYSPNTPFTGNLQRKTEVPGTASLGDFTDYTTFVTSDASSFEPYFPLEGYSSGSGPRLEYFFSIRDIETTISSETQATMYLSARARNKGTGSSAILCKLYSVLEGCSEYTDILFKEDVWLTCIDDTDWAWYGKDENGNQISFDFSTYGRGKYMLQVWPFDSDVELDEIVLATSSPTVEASNNCTYALSSSHPLPDPVCSDVVQFFNKTTGASPFATFSWNFGDGNSSTLANPVHYYSSAGSYSVTLTVTDGASSDDHSETVDVYYPIIDAVADQTICDTETGSCNFSVGSYSDQDITWYQMVSGSYSPVGTGLSYSISTCGSALSLGANDFKVCATSTELTTCEKCSTFTVTVNDCSSKMAGDQAGSSLSSPTLAIYPNPSAGLFNLDFSSETEEVLSVEVTSMQGKLVLKDQFKAVSGLNNFQLDLSNYSDGVYNVSVKTGSIARTFRITKHR